jgi:hypothetical protein
LRGGGRDELIELGNATIRKIIKIMANEESKAAKLTGIGVSSMAKYSFEGRRGGWVLEVYLRGWGGRRDED